MPHRDPTNYPLWTYISAVVFSLWGGLVTYISEHRKSGKRFSWVEAMMQVIISGFAGMLSMLFCWYIQAPAALAGFMAGISGLMGARILALFERRAVSIIGLDGDKPNE